MLANVKTRRTVADSISVRLDDAGSKPAKKMADVVTSSYGYFNLYPAVYPSVVPYPSRYEIQNLPAEVSLETEEHKSALQSTRLTPPYPFFDLCELITFYIVEM
jgi:hypothetical protein